MQTPLHLKAVVVGDSGVGKSSILLRFSNDEFEEHTEPTLGAAFVSKTIFLQDQEVRFQIFDTAGQEKYKAIAPVYYKQSEIAICVYDISDKKSFAVMDTWVKEIIQHGPGIKLMVIVGNKIDKTEEEEVSYTEGKEFADKYNALFKLASAKEGKGIYEIFISIAETYKNLEESGKLNVKKSLVRESITSVNNGVQLENPQNGQGSAKKKKRCCA